MWEDRRNINGGSWTFRVPKQNGPDFFTRVQLMAIGEKLQGCLELGKRFAPILRLLNCKPLCPDNWNLEYGRRSERLKS